MKLFSKSDFLNESREYTSLSKEEYDKILEDQNFKYIPEFFRNSTYKSGYLLLDKVQDRTPRGTDPTLIRYIDQQNPNFPSRLKSIFTRNTNKNHDFSIIPLRDTLVVFCPYYDFNISLLGSYIEPDKIGEPTYDSTLSVLYDNFYNDNIIFEQYDSRLVRTFKKFRPLEDETGKEYTDRLSDLTLWGFYTKLAQDITEEDVKTKYPREIWFSGPSILKKLD